MKKDCHFCQIVQDVIATSPDAHYPVIGEHSVIVPCKNPKAPYHMLILSKEHIGEIGDLLPTEYGTILADMFILMDNYVSGDLANAGYRIVINSGKNAGQSVRHLHINLLGGSMLRNDFGV